MCHSDVHIWDGHFDLGDGRQISLESRGVHLPFTMGHEIAGEIVALGPEASGVNIGDKVVAYPWIGCGECAVCRKGDELLCLTPRTLGTRVHGGYATHVIVPHPRYLLPHDGVPQALAATYTCSGITALSALKKARDHVGPDDHLVIIGAGGVGGSAVHIAPAVIAGKIIVADLDPQKRAHARQMGAVETIDNSAPDAVKQVMQATGGGAAAAIDFVGAPETMSFGINVLRKGGKLVMVGLYGGSCPVSTVLFPFKMMTCRRLLCRHARRSARAAGARQGREGAADPDRDAPGRPGDAGAQRFEERRQGARPGRAAASNSIGLGSITPNPSSRRRPGPTFRPFVPLQGGFRPSPE